MGFKLLQGKKRTGYRKANRNLWKYIIWMMGFNLVALWRQEWAYFQILKICPCKYSSPYIKLCTCNVICIVPAYTMVANGGSLLLICLTHLLHCVLWGKKKQKGKIRHRLQYLPQKVYPHRQHNLFPAWKQTNIQNVHVRLLFPFEINILWIKIL